MNHIAAKHGLPLFFRQLIKSGCISESDLQCTADGMIAVTKSVADILLHRGISVFPNDNNESRLCDRFFDDWYFYAVSSDNEPVCSLFKMREQEFDAASEGDGNSPGITISFIALNHSIISACLAAPTFDNRKKLNHEINRVVSHRHQSHHPALKAYFRRAEVQGPYLIAELYTAFIASLSQNGMIDVPMKYTSLCRSKRAKDRRLPLFIDSNNEAAGYTVCNHKHIFIQDTQHLTSHEKAAILATHTANTSFHSFAAEVRFHALFLTPLAKIPIPILWRSPYDSAIRADMSVDDGEFQGPTPYYRDNGSMVRRQKACHPAY